MKDSSEAYIDDILESRISHLEDNICKKDSIIAYLTNLTMQSTNGKSWNVSKNCDCVNGIMSGSTPVVNPIKKSNYKIF